jgi:hypothetical protein
MAGGRTNMIDAIFQFLARLFEFDKEPDEAIRAVLAPKKEAKKQRPKNTLVLELTRIWYTAMSTIGELTIDDRFECYILEDADRLKKRRKKVYGKTAIPRGTYEVRLTYSPRFKKKLPVLANVPGFTGIRIHAGNTPEDTEGCLLPGLTRSENFVGLSKRAFGKLIRKLEGAEREGKRIIIKVGPL